MSVLYEGGWECWVCSEWSGFAIDTSIGEGARRWGCEDDEDSNISSPHLISSARHDCSSPCNYSIDITQCLTFYGDV
jgi:hypothetical protein